MTTTEAYEDMLREMQGLLGRRVQVEVGSRDAAGRPDYRPGDETIYVTFSGVLQRGHSENGSVTFEVGSAKLPLSRGLAFSGYWRERDYRRSLEIMSLQPVVVWITPLP